MTSSHWETTVTMAPSLGSFLRIFSMVVQGSPSPSQINALRIRSDQSSNDPSGVTFLLPAVICVGLPANDVTGTFPTSRDVRFESGMRTKADVSRPF
jgi:hypothetical protein